MDIKKYQKIIFKTSLVIFVPSFIIYLTAKEGGAIHDLSYIISSISFVLLAATSTLYAIRFGVKGVFTFSKHLGKSVKKRPILLLNILAVLLFSFILLQFNSRLSNIENRFGGTEKLRCSEADVQELMNSSVYRVIGSLGEGSGFPITENSIVTNFHVIEGEPSPKVVFPDGSIETPTKIVGNEVKDVAVLTLDRTLEPLPFYGWLGTAAYSAQPTFGEPVYAAGYPLGSNIAGDVTVKKGSYGGERYSEDFEINFVQTEIDLNRGMSGGPLVDSCGQVLGINTIGLSGLSLFLDMTDVQRAYDSLSEEPVAKIEIDTSTPQGTVEAFYTYIKTRNLEKAFELLSSDRRSEIDSYEEWIQGYQNTLQVDLALSRVSEEKENRVDVRLYSSDWVDDDLVYKYFEGYWEVVEEDGELKLDASNIRQLEVQPSYSWAYSWDDEL